MKKMLALILVLSAISSFIALSAAAIVPGEDAMSINFSLTFGEIQEVLETYIAEQQLDLIIGTEAFYQFAFAQVYKETDPVLEEHPLFAEIEAFLGRYVFLYQDYLYGASALAQNSETGGMMIEALLADNSCLIYDSTNNTLSFSLSDAVLLQTLGEYRADNFAKLANAEAEISAPNLTSTASYSSYSAESAIQYARNHLWITEGGECISLQDIDYPYYGGDGGNCTNFVSQCLYAGNMPMEGTNSSAGIYDSTFQWYCKKLATNSFAVSTSWIRASDFYSYMRKTALAVYEYGNLQQLYAQCRPGDVVQLVSIIWGDVRHSIIISDKDSTTACFCADSSPKKDVNINTLDPSKYRFVLFSLTPANSTPTPLPPGYCEGCGDARPSSTYTEETWTVDSVGDCPRHPGMHDAEERYYVINTYCSQHDILVNTSTEIRYVCLD